jgi:hypothetical protein
VITVASAINQTGNNTITMADVRDYIRLQAIESGSSKVWAVVANDGAALSTVAVVIEIGMGKVVDAADQEAVDLAADFVEEVMRKFAPGRIGSAGPTLTEIAAGGAFPPQDGQADQLADVYVGVVSLTFTLFR